MIDLGFMSWFSPSTDTVMTIIEIENTGEVGAEVLIAMSVIGIGRESGTIAIGPGAAA